MSSPCVVCGAQPNRRRWGPLRPSIHPPPLTPGAGRPYGHFVDTVCLVDPRLYSRGPREALSKGGPMPYPRIVARMGLASLGGALILLGSQLLPSAASTPQVNDGGVVSTCGTGIDDPEAIAVGPDGALWFTNGNESIGRITAAGTVTTYGGSRRPSRVYVRCGLFPANSSPQGLPNSEPGRELGSLSRHDHHLPAPAPPRR